MPERVDTLPDAAPYPNARRYKDKSPPPTMWMSIVASTLFSFRYVWAEAFKRPRNFGLGLLSGVLVTFFIGVVLLGVSKAPVIFLRLTEEQTSEMDVVMLANPDEGLPFLNHSDVARRIDGTPAAEGVVPRWILPATARARFNRSASVSTNLSVRILLVDTDREEEVGLGRVWKHRVLGRGEAHVQGSILRNLGLRANRGDRMIIRLNIGETLDQQGVDTSTIAPPINGTLLQNATYNALLAALNLTRDSPVSVNATALGNALNVTLPAGFENVTVNATTIGELLDATAPVGTVSSADATSALLGTDILNPSMEVTVVDDVDDAEGKYPSALGNVVLMDYKEVLGHLADTLCYDSTLRLLSTGGNTGLPTSEELLSAVNLAENSLFDAAMLRRRVEIYLKDREDRTIDMIDDTNQMMRSLGIRYNATMQWPVATALDAVYFFQLFLNQIFYSTVFIVTMLGFLVVFLLQVTTAEERAYENGMLRALGLGTSALVQLLITQGMAFTIPAVLLALLILYLANVVAELALEDLTKISPRFNEIPVYVLLVPAMTGLVVPVLSNIIPVRKALSKSLRESLDLYHVQNNETMVSVTKLENVGIAPWQTVLGILLVVFGFVVYYLIPYSFIFSQLFLFFLLMIIILLAMLVGMCMISQAFQPYMETAMLYLLIPGGKDRVLRPIVKKNLDAHRGRNRLSYLMFTLSLASIVFGGVTFAMMDVSLQQNIEQFMGADITVQSTDIDHPLDRPALEQALEREKNFFNTVEDYAFVTFGLDQHDGAEDADVTNLVDHPETENRIHGIDRAFQRATLQKYFLTTEIQDSDELGISYESVDGKTDVVDSMYRVDSATATANTEFSPPPVLYSGLEMTNATVLPDVDSKYRWTITAIASAALDDALSLSTRVYGVFRYRRRVLVGNFTEERQQSFLFRPRAMVYKVPGFAGYSSYRSTFNTPLLVTIPNFIRMLPYNTTAKYTKLLIRVKDNDDTKLKNDVRNRVSVFLDSNRHTIEDLADIVESTSIATKLLNIFLYMLSGVAMLLDTIMLWLSFITNVKMNSWSLAVLRSLGLKANQMYRLFIYEALCLVLASFIVGLVIGTLVAVTLTLQFLMFTELPFVMVFPTGLVMSMFGLCIVSAVVGSAIPTRQLLKRQVAQVLKSG
eukprot:PhM_4_TR15359/c0_g1_i1/m.42023